MYPVVSIPPRSTCCSLQVMFLGGEVLVFVGADLAFFY